MKLSVLLPYVLFELSPLNWETDKELKELECNEFLPLLLVRTEIASLP